MTKCVISVLTAVLSMQWGNVATFSHR